MERFAPNMEEMAVAILEAPAWARLGIAAPSEGLRRRAATELVSRLMERVQGGPEPDADQLDLSL